MSVILSSVYNLLLQKCEGTKLRLLGLIFYDLSHICLFFTHLFLNFHKLWIPAC